MSAVLILGCGYTGRRTAAILARAGLPVWATVRSPEKLRMEGVRTLRLDVQEAATLKQAARVLPDGLAAVHSIPLVETAGGWADFTPELLEVLGPKCRRMVYLSTTGVYGDAVLVDEQTPAAPRTLRERLRLAAEDAVASSGLEALVLRPAAIYGPGRGVHAAIREGRFRLLEDGSNYISRIHVDDLAGITAAALRSRIQGRFPVADAEPCPSAEIARFCADLLGCPMPQGAQREQLSETRRNNRRVNGRAILGLLGYRLFYPSYRAGIPACLAAEAALPAPAENFGSIPA